MLGEGVSILLMAHQHSRPFSATEML